jgi:hypothetical protein
VRLNVVLDLVLDVLQGGSRPGPVARRQDAQRLLSLVLVGAQIVREPGPIGVSL